MIASTGHPDSPASRPDLAQSADLSPSQKHRGRGAEGAARRGIRRGTRRIPGRVMDCRRGAGGACGGAAGSACPTACGGARPLRLSDRTWDLGHDDLDHPGPTRLGLGFAVWIAVGLVCGRRATRSSASSSPQVAVLSGVANHVGRWPSPPPGLAPRVGRRRPKPLHPLLSLPADISPLGGMGARRPFFSTGNG